MKNKHHEAKATVPVQNWLKIVARSVQLIGLLITLNVILLFFTNISMGPLFGLTAVGILTFGVGWLMLRMG